MKRYLILLLALPLLLVGGCGTLNKDGVYHGDKVLYDADLTIATSYDTVHTFVTWEFRNRETLKGFPQIREYADYLRLNYPTWHRAAISARQQYVLSKSAPSSNALQLTLDVLREAVRQSQQWFASSPTAISPISSAQ